MHLFKNHYVLNVGRSQDRWVNEYSKVQLGRCMLCFVNKSKNKRKGFQACMCSDGPWNGTEEPGKGMSVRGEEGRRGRLGLPSEPF